VSYRFCASIVGFWLVACGGSTQMDETTSSSRAASQLAESMPWPKEALKTSKAAPTKPQPQPQRDTKAAETARAEEEEPQDFSGVDTTAPVDDDTDEEPRELVVEGIKGSTSNFDVRTTLENRAEDFDRCHDQMGGGGGRIVYRIHIEANGDVGRVKANPIRSRNRKLVACYTDVVSSSHFPKPHGGYADVKWTTKVGRSRKKPNSTLYSRPHRWDGASSPTPPRNSRSAARGKS
jgi:hypothetical protein